VSFAVDKEWQEMLSHSTDDVEVFWKRFKVRKRFRKLQRKYWDSKLDRNAGNGCQMPPLN